MFTCDEGLTRLISPCAKAEAGTLHRGLEWGFETGWPGTSPHCWDMTPFGAKGCLLDPAGLAVNPTSHHAPQVPVA